MSENTTIDNDRALSIKAAAQMLGVSYSTIFDKRHKLGFKLPNGRRWYIWQSTLKNLYNSQEVSVNGRIASCQFTERTKNLTLSGGLMSQRQMEEELDALLKRETKQKPKSITTD